MQQQLLQRLDEKGFLNAHQFRFRPGHSSRDALIALSLWISKVMDSGLLPVTVLIDIRKVFDSMYCPILLRKLEHIGIRGKTLDWFRLYLRDYRIDLGFNPGNNLLINCGTPQGSVLGPVFFLINVNNLYSILNLTCTILCCCKLCHNEASFQPVDDDQLVAFADDTTLECCERDKIALIFQAYGCSWGDVSLDGF